ncbi:MAG TPA: PIN domain-containing protein, partial [Terriglobales bacterium]|nr:PIN domain-containing protein [Terriglobales bacterium]
WGPQGPKSALRFAGAAPNLLPGGGPPCGISQPFAPILPAGKAARPPRAAGKQRAARALLERLWDSGAGCLSVQVLQEFYVTTTRKLPRPLAIEEAAERVREFALWRTFTPTAGDVLEAIALQQQAKINFWDAMIVHAAAELGCSTLWSEDLNASQVLRGVVVRNPFAPGIAR